MENHDVVLEHDVVLGVERLTKHFPIIRGFLRRTVGQVKAVDGVSFDVRRGETLALVGESGSGKTTTGRCILRAVEPTSGKILFSETPDTSPVDIATLSPRDLRFMQRHLGMIFQDPYSSLNPRLTVLDIIGEPFVTRNLIRNHRQLEERVAELLHSVRLDPAYMRRYPHAFSGGQRQRIAIARALALNPPFIVADEPVSALDVSVQAQILRLLKELQTERNLAYLFITHNLAVVEYISDRVAVMYVGNIVELGDTADIFARPRHPYTEALLSAVPVIEKSGDKKREHMVLTGDVADPAKVPSGCHFHPRCPYVAAICREQVPPFINVAAPDEAPHYSRCHFAQELTLRGVVKKETAIGAEAISALPAEGDPA
jgi:peptide/nickel transport system ATP-binding protein